MIIWHSTSLGLFLAQYGKLSADNINNELVTKEGDTLSLFLPGNSKIVRPDEARLTAIREPLPVYLNCWIITGVDLLFFVFSGAGPLLYIGLVFFLTLFRWLAYVCRRFSHIKFLDGCCSLAFRS